MIEYFDKLIKPEVGDGVIVTTLLPANFPHTGGFPYSRDEIATVIDVGPASGSSEGWRYAQYTVQWPEKNGYQFGPYKYYGNALFVVRKHVK